MVQSLECGESFHSADMLVDGAPAWHEQVLKDAWYGVTVAAENVSCALNLPDLSLVEGAQRLVADGPPPEDQTKGSRSIDDREEAAITAETLAELYAQYLPVLDLNQNGCLSLEELDTAVQNHDVVGQAADLVVALKTNYQELEALSNDEFGPENSGITASDVQILVGSDQHEELIQSMEKWFNGTHLKSKEQEAVKLFADGTDSVSAESVVQRQLADCYFLAAVAALVESPSGRDLLSSMITQGQNESGELLYTVKFPGVDHEVVVTPPTQSEMALYAGCEDGIWVSILEKAYGTYLNESIANRGLLNIWGASIPYETIPDSGPLLQDSVLALLTGKESHSFHTLTMSVSSIHNELASISNGEFLIAGVYPDLGPLKFDTGIPQNHMYTILSYVPAEEIGESIVTLRNPWGHGEPADEYGRALDGVNDGVFSITLAEFKERFQFLARTAGSEQ